VSEREYVGIDLHRRRSVIVRVDQEGKHLSTKRVVNDPPEVIAAVAEAGESPEVVVEATYGYYWLVDLLAEFGATVHLASPSGLNWGNRRVKNDERDALDLVKKLRLGELPEAWIAPPAIRELRELVRYRAKVVRLRAGLKPRCTRSWPRRGCCPPASTCSGRAARPSSTPWPSPTTTECASSRFGT
jgi:transposase